MKVTKYNKVDKGYLLGFFNILFKTEDGLPMFINKLKLWQKNGRRWTSFPDEKYQDSSGQDKYAPYCGMVDRESSDKIQKRILLALDEYFKQGAPSVFPTTNKSNGEQANGQESDLQKVVEFPMHDDCPF